MRILSVRLSVCLSIKRVNCDKTEEICVQIFILWAKKDHLAQFSENKNIVNPFGLKYWAKRPPLERNRQICTDIRS